MLKSADLEMLVSPELSSQISTSWKTTITKFGLDVDSAISQDHVSKYHVQQVLADCNPLGTGNLGTDVEITNDIIIKRHTNRL